MKKALQIIAILLLLILIVLTCVYRTDESKEHRELMEQLRIKEKEIEP